MVPEVGGSIPLGHPTEPSYPCSRLGLWLSNSCIYSRAFPRRSRAELLERARHWDTLKRWEKRELGQELRRLGLSYREIRELIPVSSGTLSGWCRDIQLGIEQVRRLSLIRPSEARRCEGYARRRRETLSRWAAIATSARIEAPSHFDDPFWVAGLVAYWAEGAKRTTVLQFSNSDPAMIRLFIAWCGRYLNIAMTDFKIALHVHGGQEEDERVRFWSRATSIPIEQFRKTYIKPEGTGHRKNRLYNGTASVTVRGGATLVRHVLGWIEAYSEQWAASSIGRAGAS